jgi:bacterial/archaeal transporter family protein
MKPTLIALAAGLCWGVGEAFTKSVLHTGKVGPFTAMAIRTSIALPLIWLAAILAMRLGQNPEPRDFFRADTATLLKLTLGSGLIAGAAGMLLFYLALSTGDISRIKPIAFATTVVVAMLAGRLVFHDALPPHRLLAALLITTGIALMMIK